MRFRYYDMGVRVPMLPEQAKTSERAFARVRNAFRAGATQAVDADWPDAFAAAPYPGEHEATLCMALRKAVLSVREGADFEPLEMLECEADTTPTTAAFHLMNSSYLGDVVEAAEIARVLVRHFDLAPGGFDWGVLGARESGEPAGGAAFCTREGVEYVSTLDWQADCRTNQEMPVYIEAFGADALREHAFDTFLPMSSEQAHSAIAAFHALRNHEGVWAAPMSPAGPPLPTSAWDGLAERPGATELCTALYMALCAARSDDAFPLANWPPLVFLDCLGAQGGLRLRDNGTAPGLGDAAAAVATTHALISYFDLRPAGLDWTTATDRPGASGAGAAFCTADSTAYFTTGAWLAERIAAHEQERAPTEAPAP